jgi:FkbM family methyltransferase
MTNENQKLDKASIKWEYRDVEKLIGASGIEILDGKIVLPEYCRSVRLDVGLSVNAPQSSVWISRDPTLHVFGFEPVSENRKTIFRGDAPWPVNLDPELIGKRINIIPCALMEKSRKDGLDIYVTKKDPGCSSLLKPKSFEIDYTERVEVATLNDFLKYFPFDVVTYISHLKIDVQGADIQVLEGSLRFLDRIMSITSEVDTIEYEKTRNSTRALTKMLKPYGFVLLKKHFLAKLILRLRGIQISVQADDPTFLNLRLFKTEKPNNFWVYQRG